MIHGSPNLLASQHSKIVTTFCEMRRKQKLETQHQIFVKTFRFQMSTFFILSGLWIWSFGSSVVVVTASPYHVSTSGPVDMPKCGFKTGYRTRCTETQIAQVKVLHTWKTFRKCIDFWRWNGQTCNLELLPIFFSYLINCWFNTTVDNTVATN